MRMTTPQDVVTTAVSFFSAPTAEKAKHTLSPHCGTGSRGRPLLAIAHQLLLKSIYHLPLIENTHPLRFKKATHFKMERHAIHRS